MSRKLLLAAAGLSAMLLAQPGTNSVLIDFNDLGKPEITNDVNLKHMFNSFWRVRLNASMDFVESRRLTYALNTPVTAKIGDKPGYSNAGYALGVRVNFPSLGANAYARVYPMYEVETFPTNAEGKLTNTYDGKGLLRNIGVIKTITAFVKGKNFPHSMYVNIKDENEEVTPYFLGYLNYDGWADKTWYNPAYLEQVRDRRLVRSALYPRLEPIMKLDSFTFFRNMENIDGDFIAYISKVSVIYDKYRAEEADDINDEDVWGIRATAGKKKAAQEADRLRNQNEMESLERMRMSVPADPALKR